MNLTKGQIMMIHNMVNTELSNKNTVYNPTELVNLKEQLLLCNVVGQSEQLDFKKGDYLTYIGGSATKYLKKGNKYRTTWNGINRAGRVAVVGIDNKRLVLPRRFFKI